MSQLKAYNTGTSQWEPIAIGAQGPVGPIGATGPTGAMPTDYVVSVNGVTGAISSIATTTGNLSQFATTTSAQLYGIMSDETGTGPIVFATGPTLAGPKIDNVTYGSTFITTAGGTTSIAQTSNNRYVFTGTSTQTATLPTTSVIVGQFYDITNLSTGALTINSSGGGLVATLTTGQKTTVTAAISTPTTASHWYAATSPASTLVAPLASPALSGTPTSTTATADTNTTQIATTAYVVGQASSATPLINGTATVGTSLRYAREGHIHPTDTTRAPLASPTFTGVVTAPTAVVTTTFVRPQVAPTAGTTAGATTLTAAQLATNIITWTQTAAVTLTLPSASSLDTQLGTAAVTDTAFEWSVINLGTTSGAVTMAAGTSHTYVGATVIAIGTTARFATRRSAGTPTYVTYRIA